MFIHKKRTGRGIEPDTTLSGALSLQITKSLSTWWLQISTLIFRQGLCGYVLVIILTWEIWAAIKKYSLKHEQAYMYTVVTHQHKSRNEYLFLQFKEPISTNIYMYYYCLPGD